MILNIFLVVSGIEFDLVVGLGYYFADPLVSLEQKKKKR